MIYIPIFTFLNCDMDALYSSSEPDWILIFISYTMNPKQNMTIILVLSATHVTICVTQMTLLSMLFEQICKMSAKALVKNPSRKDKSMIMPCNCTLYFIQESISIKSGVQIKKRRRLIEKMTMCLPQSTSSAVDDSTSSGSIFISSDYLYLLITL